MNKEHPPPPPDLDLTDLRYRENAFMNALGLCNMVMTSEQKAAVVRSLKGFATINGVSLEQISSTTDSTSLQRRSELEEASSERAYKAAISIFLTPTKPREKSPGSA
jgi:hypothetical protein